MKHTAIIVDDERLGRAEMRRLLTDFDDITVVGEAGNLTDAASLIDQHRPSIVFLDIQLSNESGFDLLSMVDRDFNLIFVTAFDSFAIRAFEVNALDYLLKPVNPDRLKSAIARLSGVVDTEKKPNRRPFSIDDRVLLDLGSRSVFVKVSDISHIVSAGDYSELISNDGKKFLTDKSLGEWNERLPEIHFLRIHRQTIVNLNQIDELQPWFNRTFRIRLRGVSEPLAVSRRYSAMLKTRFG